MYNKKNIPLTGLYIYNLIKRKKYDVYIILGATIN